MTNTTETDIDILVPAEKTGKASATDILLAGADALDDRAAQRDQPDGERSMLRTVGAFNILTGHALTEADGWLLMSVLKMARSRGGRHVLDDYIDGAAYVALAGEVAEKST